MGLPVLYELLQEKMKTRLLRSYGSVPEFTKRAYKLGKELGEGSVAKVLQGYSPERNELVAIKLILAEEQEKTLKFSWVTKKKKRKKRSSDKNRRIPRSDILNELKIWKKVTDISPFTLDLFKVLNFRDQVWFVMPLCTPLIVFIEDFKSKHQVYLPMNIIKEIYAGVFLALRAMHRIGIMHRDIKDENILITENLVVKLSDFDMAIDFLNEDGTRKELRSGDHPFGTYYTTPPEAYIPNSLYNETADTYSLCICMLTSRYNRIAWELGSYRRYKTMERLKSEYQFCDSQIRTHEWTVENAEEWYLACARMIPKKLLRGTDAQRFDPYPWIESRFEFSDFARKCMKWKIEERLSVEEACIDSYMQDIIHRWETAYHVEAQNLRGMMKDYAKLDLPVDEKQNMF